MRIATTTRTTTSPSTTPIITAIQFRDVGGDEVVVAIGSSLADHKLSTLIDKFYDTSTSELLAYHKSLGVRILSTGLD